MTFSNTIFLFIVTFLMQWMKKYLLDVIKINESSADIYFIIMSVTAPCSGIFIGGFILQKLGGYSSKAALYLCFICSFICGNLGIISIFVTDFIPFGFIIWFYLFIGSLINPCISGSILSSLPLEMKGTGNTLQYIFSSLVGVSSAPLVYGIVYENTKIWLPTFAMGICLSVSLLASIFVYAIIKVKNNENNLKQENISLELNEQNKE